MEADEKVQSRAAAEFHSQQAKQVRAWHSMSYEVTDLEIFRIIIQYTAACRGSIIIAQKLSTEPESEQADRNSSFEKKKQSLLKLVTTPSIYLATRIPPARLSREEHQRNLGNQMAYTKKILKKNKS